MKRSTGLLPSQVSAKGTILPAIEHINVAAAQNTEREGHYHQRLGIKLRNQAELDLEDEILEVV